MKTLAEVSEIHYVNGPFKTDGPEPVAIPLAARLPVLIPVYRPLAGGADGEEMMEGHSYYVSEFDGKIIGQHVLPIPSEMIMALIEKMRSKAA